MTPTTKLKRDVIVTSLQEARILIRAYGSESSHSHVTDLDEALAIATRLGLQATVKRFKEARRLATAKCPKGEFIG